MPTLTPTELGHLRQRRQFIKSYISFLKPISIGTAVISGASEPNRGAQSIELVTTSFDPDYVTLLDHPLTVWVGTSPGLYDVGKVRLKGIEGGTTMLLSGNSISWVPGLYITFTNEFRLWSAFPRIDDDEVFYKDFVNAGGITYTNQNEVLGPVPIMGNHLAAFLEEDFLQVLVPFGSSYDMNGGSINQANSFIEVFPNDGVTVEPILAGIVPILYTLPGQYLVHGYVENDAGVGKHSWRYHFIHQNEVNDEAYPFTDFSSLRVAGDWNKGGWDFDITVDNNASLADIPERTLAVIWQDATYGDTPETNISVFHHAKNTVGVGYLQRESIDQKVMEGGQVEFKIATIEDELKNLFMFSISLASVEEPGTWYEHREDLTMGRIVYHILQWHSTMFDVVDVLGLDGETQNKMRKYADLEKSNMYQMINQLIETQGAKHHLIADRHGRLHMADNLPLQDDTFRNGAAVVAEITDSDTTDPVGIVRNPQPRVSFVFASGFFYNGNATEDPIPLGATSPSEWPLTEGTTDINFEKQVFTGQADASEVAGQVFAVENRVLEEIRITFFGHYLGVLEPAFPEWWQIDLLGANNVREITETNIKMIVRTVTANFDIRAGTVSVEAVFQPDVDGIPGVPYFWPDAIPDDYPEPTPDPIPTEPPGTGASLYSVSSLQRLGTGVFTWEQLKADNMFDGKANSFNYIIYLTETGIIYKSDDGGATYTPLTVPDPPNEAGDSPAPTAEDLDFFEYDGSMAVSGQHIFLARWQNDDDEWRTWLLFSEDDCDTFVWQYVGVPGAGGEFLYEDPTTGSGPPSGYPYDKPTAARIGDNVITLRGKPGDPGESIMSFLVVDSEADFIMEYDLPPRSTGFDDLYHEIIVVLSDTRFAHCQGIDVEAASDNVVVAIYEIDYDAVEITQLSIDVLETGIFRISHVCGTSFSDTEILLAVSITDDDFINIIKYYSLEFDGSNTAIIDSDILVVSDGSIVDEGVVTGSIYLVDELQLRFHHYYYAQFDPSPSVECDIWGTEIKLHSTGLFDYVDPNIVGFCDMTGSLYVGMTASHVSGNTSIICYYHYDGVSGYTVYAQHIGIVSSSVEYGVLTMISTEGEIPNIDSISSCNKSSISIWVSLGISFDASIYRIRYFPLTIDGSGLTTGTMVDLTDKDREAVVIIPDIGFVYYAAPVLNRLEILLLPQGSNLMGLGVSICRGLGEGVYLTGWNQASSRLECYVYALPDITTLYRVVDLGGATEEEVEDRTFWVHPLAMFGADEFVILYGRMESPTGLSGIQHVISSVDGAAILSSNINTWGSSHCGSVLEGIELYAIRNTGEASSPVLFRFAFDAEGSEQISIINLLVGNVFPHSFIVDQNGALAVASGIPNDEMVVYSESPFAAWFTLTANHPTTRAVRSLFIL